MEDEKIFVRSEEENGNENAFFFFNFFFALKNKTQKHTDEKSFFFFFSDDIYAGEKFQRAKTKARSKEKTLPIFSFSFLYFIIRKNWSLFHKKLFHGLKKYFSLYIFLSFQVHLVCFTGMYLKILSVIGIILRDLISLF